MRNRPKGQGNTGLARRLLLIWAMATSHAAWLAAPVVLTGCPIPPPLELEAPDAAPNSPPVLMSVSPEEFAFPGRILLDHGDERRMSLTIRDHDSDTSYVYFYRNYQLPDPTPELASCVATSEDEPVRVADCATATLCTGVDETDNSDHFLEAVISDRPRLGEGQPPFRAFSSDTGMTAQAWLLQCIPPE